eukprot:2057627-Pleurochrysis_carterae.AAC.1
MDAPSPIAPSFTFPAASTASGTAGPTTRSAPAGAAPSAAPLTAAQPVSSVRPRTTEERDHFVISPEQLASVDRQLMETILGTITSPATRPAYR